MKKIRINITTTKPLEARIAKFLGIEGNEYLNRSVLDNIAIDYYIEAMTNHEAVVKEGV